VLNIHKKTNCALVAAVLSIIIQAASNTTKKKLDKSGNAFIGDEFL
jgi:hypothetical protein